MWNKFSLALTSLPWVTDNIIWKYVNTNDLEINTLNFHIKEIFSFKRTRKIK